MDSALNRLHALVVDPATPHEATDAVLIHGPWVLVASLAANPQTPGGILGRLLEIVDDDARMWDVMQRVAGNPNVPARILEAFSRDPHPGIRMWIAERPGTPVEILERLVFDDDEWVREHLARNPALPPSILERLRHDPSASVRDTVDRKHFGKVDPPTPDGGANGEV